MLVTGPFMAHCISKGYVLSYDSDWEMNIPICDDWVSELFTWIAAYINKMKADLVDLQLWEI